MKVAICIPVNGDTRALFTLSLGRMLQKTATDWTKWGLEAAPETEIFMAESSLLGRNRETLVAEAEKWSADWILWLDSDQTFPPEALLRLLGAGQPVVGCNYPRRHDSARPTAMIETNGDATYVVSTKEKIERGELEPVTFMGFGVCLVSMGAVRSLERPLFGGDHEDIFFFKRLRDAGFVPLVDHQLSAHVGHIRTQVLTNDHTLRSLQGGTISVPVAAGETTAHKA